MRRAVLALLCAFCLLSCTSTQSLDIPVKTDDGWQVARPDEVGLDADSAGKYLAGDRNRDIVRTREAQARSAGLIGVPSIIVNGQLAVMGVQGTDTILAAIDQALFHELSDAPGAGVVH